MAALTAPPATRRPAIPHMRIPPGVLRLAWHARNLWHRIARPLTMGVRAIVLDGDRVLLIRHSYVGGWHLPGGGVQKHETLAEAMRREVREEVGLIAEDGRFFGLYARFRHGASDHVGVFVVRAWSGAVQPDGVEILEARFVPLDALPAETSPATRRRLAEVAAGQPAERW